MSIKMGNAMHQLLPMGVGSLDEGQRLEQELQDYDRAKVVIKI